MDGSNISPSRTASNPSGGDWQFSLRCPEFENWIRGLFLVWMSALSLNSAYITCSESNSFSINSVIPPSQKRCRPGALSMMILLRLKRVAWRVLSAMIQSVLQIKRVSLEIITSKKQRPVSWSDLPENLLYLISIRLNHCDDYLSFKRVCVTWRAAMMELKQCHCSPFLMLPPRKYDKYGGRRCLLSPSEGRHHKLDLPGISTDYVCIGSFFHGWLLMIDTISRGTKSFFFNPSTSARIDLLRWNTCVPIDLHDINRVVLSSAPTDPNCTVIILHNCFGRFRICRVGDGEWRLQSKLWGIISISVFKGKVYLLYHKKPDLNFKSTTNITTLEFEYLEPPHHPNSSRIKSRKLVESGGELLLVEKYRISTGSGRAFSHGVFRLDLSTSSWIEMKQIGNRVLFLGPCCCASFSATGLGCRENQIYTIESLHGYTNHTWSVYNMVDGSVKSFLSSHDTFWGNAIWITTRFV